ncbi:MAG: hypothetical protein WCF07_07845 [Nitrososphaeraceae archaeon]
MSAVIVSLMHQQMTKLKEELSVIFSIVADKEISRLSVASTSI